MALQISINGEDRTSFVEAQSVEILGDLNEYVNTLTFNIKQLTSRNYLPNLNDIVYLTDDGTRIFGGHVVRRYRGYISKDYNLWRITVVDFTELLERQLVRDVYVNTRAGTIVQNLITASQQKITISSDSFSQSNPVVSRISFNGLTTGQALTKLAKFIGRTWWCDHSGVVHIAANDDLPSVSVKDDGTGIAWIRKSFSARDDLSQVRNHVDVRGANVEGDETTRTIRANGSDIYFHTVVPFSGTPSVSLNDVEQDVGIEYASRDEDHDVFHDSRTHTIRFKTPPTSNSRIVISGKVLVPIFYTTNDEGSIRAYGRREYPIDDATIRTTAAAVERADREIDLYKNPPIDGSFRTYDIASVSIGWRINIVLPSFGINTSGVITGIQIRWRDTEGEKPVATVMFYSTKHFGIIDYIAGFREDEEEEILFSRQTTVGKRFVQQAEAFSISDSDQSFATRPPAVSRFPSNPSAGDRVELTREQAIRYPFVSEDFSSFKALHFSTDNLDNVIFSNAQTTTEDAGDVPSSYEVMRDVNGTWTQLFQIRTTDPRGIVVPPVITGSPDGYIYYVVGALDASRTALSKRATFLYTIERYNISDGTTSVPTPLLSMPNRTVGVSDMSVVSGGHVFVLRSNGLVHWYRPTINRWIVPTLPPRGDGETIQALSTNESGNLTATIVGNGTMALYEWDSSTLAWDRVEVFESNLSRFSGIAMTGTRKLTTAGAISWNVADATGSNPQIVIETAANPLYTSEREVYKPGIYRYDGTKWV